MERVFTNRLRYILQHKYFFKIIAIITLLIIIALTYRYHNKSIYKDSDSIFTGTVYKKKITDNKITFYIKGKEKLVVNYYDKISSDISLGDEIQVNGELTIPNNNTINNLFNYKKYLYYNEIYYIVKAKEIKKIANNTNIIYYLKDKINQRIEKITYSHEYIKIFILGDTTSLDEEINTSFRENGVSHLFSISGMHISLFASIILYFLKRISYNNYYNYSIVISFLIFYSLLVGALPSVIRSLVMYILFTIDKLFNLKANKINIMCIALILIIVKEPYYIYNLSFQYSYIITFSLVLYHDKIKKIKHKLNKSLYTSFISFLFSFPICIYNFYQVNILSIFLNIILIPFVSITIFPLSIICFIIPKLSFLLAIFTNILKFITLTVSNLKIGLIVFAKPNLFIILLYYLFIILFINNKKNIYLFFLILAHKLYIYLIPYYEITYLTVGQGDSTLIRYPHNKANILIDTGGLLNSDYSITLNQTIPYLKSLGLNKIDYLLLTHGDYDHLGDATNLIENFKVAKVIFNCGEYNELEENLIELLDKKNIPYYSCIKQLNISNNKLYFLNNKTYDNENDNSSVIYTKFYNYNFLFMGDASKEVEEDLIEKYHLKNITTLKVGHHGSDTSSSKSFITKINPKYSIISVGKNNFYNHPNESVLNTLSKSKIYRTDQDGSIMFKINKDKLQIENNAP